MNPKISQALTTGLINGYGGKTQFTKINRGDFELSSSHFQSQEFVYHDEWTNNGGQELVAVGHDSFTRLYGGGIVDQNILKSLDITDENISQKLKTSLLNFTDQTRLFSDFQSDLGDGWFYKYQILDKNDQIQVINAKESISYQNQTVFIHYFILSPIKK